MVLVGLSFTTHATAPQNKTDAVESNISEWDLCPSLPVAELTSKCAEYETRSSIADSDAEPFKLTTDGRVYKVIVDSHSCKTIMNSVVEYMEDREYESFDKPDDLEWRNIDSSYSRLDFYEEGFDADYDKSNPQAKRKLYYDRLIVDTGSELKTIEELKSSNTDLNNYRKAKIGCYYTQVSTLPPKPKSAQTQISLEDSIKFNRSGLVRVIVDWDLTNKKEKRKIKNPFKKLKPQKK